jgi:subtilisin family serine protease
MGSAVGDDGAGNQVGVAPGARWIACRNMDEGIGRPSTYIECLQFFLAPTDLDGQSPDPTRRPNVVGNSYSCPPDEGCDIGALRAAFENLRAAGVFMAVAAGNEGEEGCASVKWPPALYDSAVSVGATDLQDRIAFFSSRGPVRADGSGRVKPDLVAPGVAIRSATATGYGVLSGTSMAAPHVGGAVLLLWSALPQLAGNVDATEQLLASTAVPATTTDACGGDTASEVPNNTYGHGRIDVVAAYRRATGAPASRPTLSVANVALREGNAGRRSATFTVSLSERGTQAVSVSYRTRARTARPGSDFVGVGGRLTFAAGQRVKTVRVMVLGDRRREPNETFDFVLRRPAGATLRRAVASGTIRNDD